MIFLACLLLALIPLEARTPPVPPKIAAMASASKVRPPLSPAKLGGCKTYVDSVANAFDRDEPEYLEWPLPVEECTEAQNYRIYYYRGMGSYFLSSWGDALLYFGLAKQIGGPEDEQVLYYLWRTHGKLGDSPEQTQLIWEFYNRFPQSSHLGNMFSEWKTDTRPSLWSLSMTNSVSQSESPGYSSTRIRDQFSASIGQSAGNHRFRESVALSINTDPETRIFGEWQGNLTGEYRYKGLSANLNWGSTYARAATAISALDTVGTPGTLSVDQYQADIGYSLDLGKIVNTEFQLQGIHPRAGWTMASFGQSLTTLAGEVYLQGTWTVERHWMSFFPVDSLFPTLNGQWVGNLGAYAFYELGKHGFSLGTEYRWDKETYAPALDTILLLDVTPNVGKTLAAVAGYSFRPAAWCDVDFQGKWGHVYNSETADGRVLQFYIALSLHR